MPTYQPKHCKPYHSLGLSLSRGSISWDHSLKPQVVLSSFLWQFTNSLSGSRLSPLGRSLPKFIQWLLVRFGSSNRIIMENGTQFASSAFRDYCEEIKTKVCYAFVAHPQNNEHVERANWMILQGIKIRVFDRLKSYSRRWVDELPTVWPKPLSSLFLAQRQCFPPWSPFNCPEWQTTQTMTGGATRG